MSKRIRALITMATVVASGPAAAQTEFGCADICEDSWVYCCIAGQDTCCTFEESQCCATGVGSCYYYSC